ncbi:MAG: hypothetical protein HON90_00015 [Halobacteriovoraceae bacterium]|jgi:hypothetical protein|nr:hypothetical protein [Halobacteriovoraceae bacterium]
MKTLLIGLMIFTSLNTFAKRDYDCGAEKSSPQRALKALKSYLGDKYEIDSKVDFVSADFSYQEDECDRLSQSGQQGSCQQGANLKMVSGENWTACAYNVLKDKKDKVN